jgi:ribosomal protein S2
MRSVCAVALPDGRTLLATASTDETVRARAAARAVSRCSSAAIIWAATSSTWAAMAVDEEARACWPVVIVRRHIPGVAWRPEAGPIRSGESAEPYG